MVLSLFCVCVCVFCFIPLALSLSFYQSDHSGELINSYKALMSPFHIWNIIELIFFIFCLNCSVCVQFVCFVDCFSFILIQTPNYDQFVISTIIYLKKEQNKKITFKVRSLIKICFFCCLLTSNFIILH